MAKRGKPAGNKRQRERDKARKREEKDARRKWLKELRDRGIDPDAVDAEGRPLYDHDGHEIRYRAAGEAVDGVRDAEGAQGAPEGDPDDESEGDPDEDSTGDPEGAASNIDPVL